MNVKKWEYAGLMMGLSVAAIAWFSAKAANPCVANWAPWAVATVPEITMTAPVVSNMCLSVSAPGAYSDPIAVTATVTTKNGIKQRLDQNHCEEPQLATLSLGTAHGSWYVGGCGATPNFGAGN